ncbi:GNAT family N-acetyltransferase [Cellulomonas shaoxiangyii]|uniref:N-acetyltransferase n=1 Tax=Cellulomonas shaoxiangyii TaxID=2566013 RepID=A0A4P7SEX1_9CELL|nr:GNAT family N-acetyltransferase [Cellulomonas shaoxiangyii]QCB92400.1 N-acetyltransferase [Cellulomonas shaoxiangyii]TGY82188.1 N-acetyltransferase [Cellulomonas shaoxiangyii]
MTDVVVTDVPDALRFEARTPGGDLVGTAAYERRGDDVVLTHTVVEPAAEGHGIGSALVRQALDQLRAAGARVVPQCAFVRAFVAEHPEYRDMVIDH